MVESREADELPELSEEAAETRLGEVGELTLGSADTDDLRTVFMWKNVAAENVQQSTDSPSPPEGFDDHSIAQLRDVRLSAASSAAERLRLLEYYLSEGVL